MIEVEGGARRFFAEGSTTRADRVWQLWTNPQTWGEWDLGLRSASLTGPFAPGAVGRIVDLSGRSSRFTVEDVSPGTGYRYRVALPGARLVLTRTLRAAGADPSSMVTVRHEVAFAGLLGGGWALLLGRGFRRQLGPTVERVLAAADRDG
jgi:hypothetical protein